MIVDDFAFGLGECAGAKLASSAIEYNVPPSACVIFFAATNIFSSRRLMSRSLDSAAPIALLSFQ